MIKSIILKQIYVYFLILGNNNKVDKKNACRKFISQVTVVMDNFSTVME